MDKKQEQLPQVAPKDETLIRTMPEKYVGASLKATLSGVRQGVVSETPTAAPPSRAPVPPPPQVHKPPVITAPPQKKGVPKLVIFSGVAVLLVGVVIAVFLVPRKKVTPPPVNTKTPVVVTQPPANVEPPPTVATTTPPEFSGPVRNAPDQDADGLTNSEEQEVYKTEAGNPDTDNDGYLDGSEVFYLYNPAAVAPTTLLASGIVRQSDNPMSGFSVYVPAVWALNQGVDAFTATGQTGEFVQISSETVPLGTTLLEWYALKNPTIEKNSVMTFVNRAGLTGIKATDGLAAYFVANDRAYTVSYMSGERKELSYRRTFEMMVNSFKLMRLESEPQVFDPAAASSTLSVVNEMTTSTPATASTTPEVTSTSTPITVPEQNPDVSTQETTTSTTP